MSNNNAQCGIEHHAVLFALLARQAIIQRGDEGREAILKAMTVYGNERGRRMAANAHRNGDELTVMTNQAYSEWQPEYAGQAVFGQIRTEPTLQTYISKCPWCDAWEKYDLSEYGRYYCVNIDNAVYQGFRPDFVCTQISTPMSWGGARCDFDWQYPLSEQEAAELPEKKQQLGDSCMRNFDFHTAHLYFSISRTLSSELGSAAQLMIAAAGQDFVDIYGCEYWQAIMRQREYFLRQPEESGGNEDG